MLTLMVRAVVERDARRKNKAIQHARRKARLAWHPSTLGRNFAKLPVYHVNNPGSLKAPPPLPPTSTPTAESKSEDTEEKGIRLVTDMDLSPLVDGIRTTAYAGRLPINPASRARPAGYVPPKLAITLKQIELEGSTWYDHLVISANKVRAKMKERQDKKRQRKLAKLREEDSEYADSDEEEDSEEDSEEYDSEESDSEEEENEKESSGWLPNIMQPAHRLAEAIRSSPFIPFKSDSSLEAGSSTVGDGSSFTESLEQSKTSQKSDPLIEGGSSAASQENKSIKLMSKKLALTPEEKRKKSEVARANFTDVSGFPLDSASVTLELACPLPPRFQMVPNPLHEDNMHPVKRVIHQA